MVALVWNNLGLAWKALGEYDKAIEYLEKSLEIRVLKLGENHPHTKATKKNLETAKKEKK